MAGGELLEDGRTASSSSRRLATAVVAVVVGAGAAVATASPAGALPAAPGTAVNAGQITQVTVPPGGGLPDVSGAAASTPGVADTTTITPAASRTILDLDGFALEALDTLSFRFASADDIVLLRVAGPATVGGRITAQLGSGATGGNVWIQAAGATFAPGSAVTVGGFLATTSVLSSDADFMDDGSFSFAPAPADAPIALDGGISGSGSVLAFLAPSITQAGSVGNAFGSTDTEVLYAAARGGTLTFAGQPHGLDLLGSSLRMSDRTSALVPLYLAGTTRASDVFVSTAAAGGSLVRVDPAGRLVADGAPAGGSGQLVMSVGGSLSRAGATAAMATAPLVGGGTDRNSLSVGGQLAAQAGLDVRAVGDVQLSTMVTSGSGNTTVAALGGDLSLLGGVVSGSTVALSALRRFDRGSAVIDARTNWVIYAAGPGLVSSGPTSDRTAFWNARIATRPPAAALGNRYFFAESPLITFTSLDAQKDFGEVVTDFDFAEDGAYANQPGAGTLYVADTAATAYEGAPALRSPGTAAGARVLEEGPYPISISIGSLRSPAGYGFSLASTGRLTVIDPDGPAVDPAIDGTLGSNGWYTSPVTLGWIAEDEESYIVSRSGCDERTLTDQEPTSYTCTAVSPGGSTSRTSEIKVDTVAPVVVVPGAVTVYAMDRFATATWDPPTSTDLHPGGAPASCDRTSGTSFELGTTTVRCSATDAAGNVGTASFPVTVKKIAVTFASPVDAWPTMNIAKLGRVVPVKATITVDGQPVRTAAQPVHVQLSSAASCAGATGDDIEAYAAGSSATGNLFRWDAAADRWTYNLDTGAFGAKANACYRVAVHYGGTVTDGRATGGSTAGYFFLQTKK